MDPADTAAATQLAATQPAPGRRGFGFGFVDAADNAGDYSSSQNLNVDPVAVPPVVGGFVPQSGVAMRQKMWDGRECDTCGLQIHEQDARFCRRCGGKVGHRGVGGHALREARGAPGGDRR